MCECVYHGCCYWCQNTAALCLSCSLGHWETVVMETGGLLCLFPCHTDGKATLHDRHELDGVCGPEQTDWLLYSFLYPAVGTIEQQCVEPRPWAGWGLWSRSSWRQGGIQHTHTSASLLQNVWGGTWTCSQLPAAHSKQPLPEGSTTVRWMESGGVSWSARDDWQHAAWTQQTEQDQSLSIMCTHGDMDWGGNCRIIHICCKNRLPGIVFVLWYTVCSHVEI